MTLHRFPRFQVLLGLLLVTALSALQAAPLPSNELERACWLRYTRERSHPPPASQGLSSVDFSNLRDGDTVRSPFVVDFAVRGMGVAPAGPPQANTGHHHLLIDTRLPLNVAEKIPFSDTHKHFGKGQTSTVLDLPPGEHRLRLLFANHEHRPYYVFSPEIRVTVAGARRSGAPAATLGRGGSGCAEWYAEARSRPRPPGEWVSIVNLRSGEPVISPFALHFGVEGYGVCAAGRAAERTGHFLLEVLRDGRSVQTLDLRNGATQATLTLAPSLYQLRLRFVDAATGNDLLPAYEHSLPVTGQDRL